tara:strand:+ start:63 stop:1829 length:1767 start_codon:yes stop_codon:yes gene_type:complete
MSQTKAQLIDPVDGTIVNADINASAAIAGSKISPNFGSQNIISGSITTSGAFNIESNDPTIFFTEGDGNPDYKIMSNAGVLKFIDATADTSRIIINTDGHVDVTGNLDVGAGLDVTGAITSTGSISSGDLTITSGAPFVSFVDSDHNSDFNIQINAGALNFNDTTNSATRISIASNGTVDINGNLDVGSGIDVTGDLSVSGEVQIADYIVHTGDGNTAIRFPSDDTIAFQTAGSERFRIASDGRSYFVGSSSGGFNATSLPNGNTININTKVSNDGVSVIRYSGSYAAYGLNIGRSKSDTLGTNTIVADGDDLGHITWYGADGTDFNQSAVISAQVDGTPSDGTDMPGRLIFKTSADGSGTPTERLRLGSAGQFGIAGANYGTSGQALVSQGASAAPQWASVSSVTTGSSVSLSGTNQVFGSIPATAIIVRILFQNLFSTGSGRPMFRVGHAGSGGTLLTSGYKGYTGYWYRNLSSLSPNNNSNSTMIPVVNAGWNNVSYKWNGYIEFIRVNANASNQSQSWISETHLRENNSNYWDTVGGTQYNVDFYGISQIYMGDNISLDRIEVNANGSSSGQTLGGAATLQYFE